MKAVANTLGVARSHLHDKVHQASKPRGPYRKTEDGELRLLVRRLVDERPTYGYRRITALATESWPARASRRSTTSACSASCGRTGCCSPGTPVARSAAFTTAR